jgi:hypothetical protein
MTTSGWRVVCRGYVVYKVTSIINYTIEYKIAVLECLWICTNDNDFIMSIIHRPHSIITSRWN